MGLWYETFRLKANPFAFSDAGVEKDLKGFVKPIEGDFLYKIGHLLESGVSCIILGERGLGKTSLAFQLRMKGETVIFTSSDYHANPVTDEKGNEYHVSFLPREQRIILDFPDDVSKKGVKQKVFEIEKRIKNSPTLPLMILANQEQYDMLRRYDTTARLPVIEMPRPSKEFYLQLFKERIIAVTEGEPIMPFQPVVVEKLAEVAGTPRQFIQFANLILVQMRFEGLKEPAGLDLLSRVRQLKPSQELDIVKDIVSTFTADGRGWIKVKEIAGRISEKHGLEIRNDRLGRMMQTLGYAHRYNPDSEYMVGVGK